MCFDIATVYLCQTGFFEIELVKFLLQKEKPKGESERETSMKK